MANVMNLVTASNRHVLSEGFLAPTNFSHCRIERIQGALIKDLLLGPSEGFSRLPGATPKQGQLTNADPPINNLRVSSGRKNHDQNHW
jgi:hypothetical protein